MKYKFGFFIILGLLIMSISYFGQIEFLSLQLLQVGISLLVLGLPIVGYFFFKKPQLNWYIPPISISLWASLLWGATIFGIAYPIGELIIPLVAYIFQKYPFLYDLFLERQNAISKMLGEILVLNIFVIAIIPAFLEELFFRVIILDILKKINIHWRVFISAIFFSAVHLDIMAFLPIFCIGLILGYLWIYTQFFWIIFVCHCSNNLAGIFLNQSIIIDPFVSQSFSDYFLWGLILFCGIIIVFFSFKKIVDIKENSFSV